MKYILIMDLEARKAKTERLYQVIYNIAIHHRTRKCSEKRALLEYLIVGLSPSQIVQLLTLDSVKPLPILSLTPEKCVEFPCLFFCSFLLYSSK